MTTLDPLDKNEADRILSYDRKTLAENGRDKLFWEQKLQALSLSKEIKQVFEQANRLISTTNKEIIVDELMEFTLLIFDCLLYQSKQKDQFLKNTLIGEFNQPTEIDLAPLAKYRGGEMYWGRDSESNPILMLKFGDQLDWLPHTDSFWDELLKPSDRSMSKELPGASNGIGEFQFLIKHMGWTVIPNPSKPTD